MKEQISIIDATPSKRLFLSIIADYDLNRSICELVDNAIDLWKINGRSNDLCIRININLEQQRIEVIDNSGGISPENLSFIVSPGKSMNNDIEETIGFFGVGTKRAVVALAQEVRITTRKSEKISYQVEIDDDWIYNDDGWNLPVYKVPDIEENSTKIEMFRLRKHLNEISIKKLDYYLSTTYAILLNDERLEILLNDEAVIGITYENWAYPPEYPPRICLGRFDAGSTDKVDVIVTYGLTDSSNDVSGEYGVYFYCNDRLIGRDLKSYDVGFGVGRAGKPCDAISLSRIIIQLNGKPNYMPWNSSKSDINTSHATFILLQEWVGKILKHVASLSRRMRVMEGGWKENVFKYTEGELVEEQIEDFEKLKTDYLPPLPISTPRYADVVKQENKEISNKHPWTTGLYESVIAVDLILRSKLEQRNRIALILLDSTLEIGFKEFLVNQATAPISEKRLAEIFNNRINVHEEMKKISSISEDDWRKIKHYYYIRCQLIHSRASVTIVDDDIDKFREVVERVLLELYGLKFPRKVK